MAALLSTPAAAARAPRRDPDQRRRPRHPLRRRLRGRRARAAAAGASATRAHSRELLPDEASVRTRSTCSARRPPRPTRRCSPPLLADPRVDARDRARSCRRSIAGADEVADAIARRRERRADEAGAGRRDRAERTPPALDGACRRRLPLSRVGRRARSAAPPSAPTGCAGPAGAIPELAGSTAPPREASSPTRSQATTTSGSTPTQSRALLEAYGIPLVARARRRRRRRGGRRRRASSASRSSSSRAARRRAQDRERRRRARPATTRPCRAAAARIGGPVIVQPMVRGGVELLAGVVQDPVFGPLVAFGPGGVMAELIGDADFRLAPLTDVDADELVHDRQGRAGSSPASAARRRRMPRRCIDLLHRLARLAEDFPEFAELDLNPVVALADSCCRRGCARAAAAPGRAAPSRRAGSARRETRNSIPRWCRMRARRRSADS